MLTLLLSAHDGGTAWRHALALGEARWIRHCSTARGGTACLTGRVGTDPPLEPGLLTRACSWSMKSAQGPCNTAGSPASGDPDGE